MNTFDTNDDWILVEADKETEKEPSKLFQMVQAVKKYYKNALFAYNIYRVVKLCIKIYILLHVFNNV